MDDKSDQKIDYSDELKLLVLNSSTPITEIERVFSIIDDLEKYLNRFAFNRIDRDKIFIKIKEAKLRSQNAFKILRECQFDIRT